MLAEPSVSFPLKRLWCGVASNPWNERRGTDEAPNAGSSSWRNLGSSQALGRPAAQIQVAPSREEPGGLGASSLAGDPVIAEVAEALANGQRHIEFPEAEQIQEEKLGS